MRHVGSRTLVQEYLSVVSLVIKSSNHRVRVMVLGCGRYQVHFFFFPALRNQLPGSVAVVSPPSIISPVCLLLQSITIANFSLSPFFSVRLVSVFDLSLFGTW
ncbi:unnamed protein product [Discosporangium mesarthrocarpum]